MYKSDFKDIVLKLATNEWSKTFLLTSIKTLSPGAVCPCPGAIYMYKIIKKNSIKSDSEEIFLKLATNDRSDKMFLLTSKLRPQGVVSPCPGAIYMYKSWKKLYKIRHWNFCETCTKRPKWQWQEVSVDIKILSTGVVCPWPAAIYIYYIMKKICIKSEAEEMLYKIATNDQWWGPPVDIKVSALIGCLPLH